MAEQEGAPEMDASCDSITDDRPSYAIEQLTVEEKARAFDALNVLGNGAICTIQNAAKFLYNVNPNITLPILTSWLRDDGMLMKDEEIECIPTRKALEMDVLKMHESRKGYVAGLVTKNGIAWMVKHYGLDEMRAEE